MDGPNGGLWIGLWVGLFLVVMMALLVWDGFLVVM